MIRMRSSEVSSRIPSFCESSNHFCELSALLTVSVLKESEGESKL